MATAQVSNPDTDDLAQALKSLSDLSPDDEAYSEAVQRLIQTESLLAVIKQILEQPTVSSPTKPVQAAKLVAELAKAEPAREVMLEYGMIPALVPLLSSTDKELSLQCIRALGNLCYEQDGCRHAVLESNGLEELQTLMNFCLHKHNAFFPLKTACCGFLHNLLNGNERCQKAVLNMDLLTLIKTMIELHANYSNICNFCYMSLSSIADVDGGKQKIYESGVVSTLLKAFVNTSIRETDDFLIQLISTLTAESDDIKHLLADSSVDMHLLSIISVLSNSTEEQERQLVKAASELLVLVLTGDEAMEIWFDRGNGFVFTSICEWLQGNNGQLLQSAAFALGNFARNDDNSSIIIQREITLHLYKCLDQLYDFREDHRTAPTIHAVLSALRNLAIAYDNKMLLLDQDILTHLLPYLDCENTIVTSKLVGVLRLLIDRNEKHCTELCKDETVIKRLVKFGHSDSNMLLKGESTRCLSWIIKGTKNPEALRVILSSGVVPHLVYLVSSQHAVMQNDGLISLILLSSALPEEASPEILESELIPTLKELLSEEEPKLEVIQNSLTLVHQLSSSSQELKVELEKQNILDCMIKLVDKFPSSESIQGLIRSLEGLFTS